MQCFNLSQHASTFLWNFGDGCTSTETNPKHYYTHEGEYHIQLIANNEYQCPDTFTIYRAVVAKSEGKIEFPSAFTPNPNGPNGGYYNPNDYNNDVFHPVFVGVEKYKLSIFNRWGELIFESEDPNIGWDGYYRGELCKQDVYVWKVSGKFVNGENFFKAGDVTLLR
ncbi:MAG: gliding motility-associated C-terminal domain-containing protein [Bacteroidales bacterium]|nr:gliding motility-associated C-terminal domain-containing protein [Bacteroidales bacterium]